MVRSDWPKDRLDRLVLPLVGAEDIVEIWWNSPNKALGDWTPWALYQTEDWHMVVKYILYQYNV